MSIWPFLRPVEWFLLFFLVKMVKTVKNFSNFEKSFLPVVDQKYRFSLPFLRGKMTFFSKKVKNRHFYFIEKNLIFRALFGSTRSLRRPFSEINIPKPCVTPRRYKRIKISVDLTVPSSCRAILMTFLRMPFFPEPPHFSKILKFQFPQF